MVRIGGDERDAARRKPASLPRKQHTHKHTKTRINTNLHAVAAVVVKAADKGRHQIGPGLGRQQRLRRRKHERQVDLDALPCERARRLEAVQGARDFDDRLGLPSQQLLRLLEHAFGFCC